MNSKQLRWILSSDPITRKTFVDVYARDEIKLINSVAFPSAYIFNFDPNTKPGPHWVAVYFHSKQNWRIFPLIRSSTYSRNRAIPQHLCRKMAIQSTSSSRIIYNNMWTVFSVLHLPKMQRIKPRLYSSKILYFSRTSHERYASERFCENALPVFCKSHGFWFHAFPQRNEMSKGTFLVFETLLFEP